MGDRPIEWLRRVGAQGDVVDGLARFENWESLWAECPRGDWLLGIAERLGVPSRALVGAALGCARIVEHEGGSKDLLDSVERWVAGGETEDAVADATRAFEAAAGHPDPASEAAARAALAVGLGVADRQVLSGAPAATAESVIVASIDCGLELAMRWAHDKCAVAVRTAIPWSTIQACVERIEGPG